MSNNSSTNKVEDIIDNRLESFPFFPIRLVFYMIAIGCLGFFWHSIVSLHLLDAFVALLFFTLTFAVAIVQKRITINLQTNKYREYYNFFGIKKGAWESFKGFTILTITPSSQINRLGSKFGVNSIDVESDVFYLNLKKDNYNKITIAAGDHGLMLEKAIVLAHRYQIGIMDCRKKPNVKYAYEEVVQQFPKKTY